MTGLDAAGNCVFRVHVPGSVLWIDCADLDGDGREELLYFSDGRLHSKPFPNIDPRVALREEFTGAVEAAERGEEAAASKGFAHAGTRWVGLEDRPPAALRARLSLLSNANESARPSAAARRALAILDRAHPAAPDEWIGGVADLVAAGREDLALRVAKLHRDSDIKIPRNDWALVRAAWRWVDPDRPKPRARRVALALARMANAASSQPNPNYLNTLAAALFACGRRDDALAAVDQAAAAVVSKAQRPTREELAAYRARYAADPLPESAPADDKPPASAPAGK
jgi:hypothetical protein